MTFLTLILFFLLIPSAWSQTPQCFGLGEVIPGTPQPEKQCCVGLTSVNLKDAYDENCQEKGVGGYAGVCIACGDHICDDRYETKCNCPVDCDSHYKKGSE